MNSGKIKKVQYGSGFCNPEGWVNYDSAPAIFIGKIPFAKLLSKIIYNLIKKKNSTIAANLKNIIKNKSIYGDISKGLNEKDESIDYLYASHVLEHLPLKEFRFAMKESHRILKKGGVFRFVVPNLKFFVEQYLNSKSKTKSIDFCLETYLGKETFGNIFSKIRGDSHHIMFDYETLEHEISNIGFSNSRRAMFKDSHFKVFEDVEDKNRWAYPENIGFECIK